MIPAAQDFRAWVRAHHPDVGGDPAEFVAGLERWRGDGGRRVAAEVVVFRSRGGLWLLARWARRRITRPRHVRKGT